MDDAGRAELRAAATATEPLLLRGRGRRPPLRGRLTCSMATTQMIFGGRSTVDLVEVISIHILIHQLAHTGACSAQFGASGAQQRAWSPGMPM